jgi:hypothetical protein
MDEAMIQQAMEMSGCSEEQVLTAYEQIRKPDVVEIVSFLLTVPKAKGDKFLPSKPTIDDGLTPDVRAKLKQAREFSEALNKLPMPIASPKIGRLQIQRDLQEKVLPSGQTQVSEQ